MRVEYMMNLFTRMLYTVELQYLQAKSRKIKGNTSSFVERFIADTSVFIYTELPFRRCMSFGR